MLIVHGGDGTVNEVVNGVLGECGRVPPADVPALGVVPGGSANVFARALGISPDPIDATNQLIDLLTEHRETRSWRRIGLMDCGERWGVFTAGLGVDGDVVAAVEAQRDKGRNGHRVALHPRRGARDAGQRAQGTDADPAPARP